MEQRMLIDLQLIFRINANKQPVEMLLMYKANIWYHPSPTMIGEGLLEPAPMQTRSHLKTFAAAKSILQAAPVFFFRSER